MNYTKQYKPTSIRLVGIPKGETTYLSLYWNYGFSVQNIGADGEFVTKYRTLRVSIGHAIPKCSWVVPIEETKPRNSHEEGDFSPAFRRKNKSLLSIIISDAEQLRERIFKYYVDHLRENGTKPHPEQILTAVKGKAVSAVRVRLSDYIRQHARSPLVTNDRTAKKFRGLADMVDVLVAVRKSNILKDYMLGSGDIHVDSMCEADWIDFRTLYQRAACMVTITYRAATSKGMDGVAALRWTGKSQPAFYSVNTLEKAQQNLKTVLARAKKSNLTKLDLDTLDKVSRKEPKKEHLEADEIAKVITTRFDQDYLENTRRLFLIEILTGVPVGGMRRLLDRPITLINGKHIKFPAVWSVRDKTKTPHLIPIFQGAWDLLSGPDKPHMISDSDYNAWLKIICSRMGLDRAFQVCEPKANGSMPDKLVPLHTQVSSHTCRRSLKVLLEGDLHIPRERVCDMFGHSYGDKSADRAYMTVSPERSAELLVRQVMDEQDILPFQLVGNCVQIIQR